MSSRYVIIHGCPKPRPFLREHDVARDADGRVHGPAFVIDEEDPVTVQARLGDLVEVLVEVRDAVVGEAIVRLGFDEQSDYV
jgi:hypothetical protein